MNCPDPSAHVRDTSMQDSASTAAISVANSKNIGEKEVHSDKGRALSSAGAAASLKYVTPGEHPEFPVKKTHAQTSAGAAATIANANKTVISAWRPEKSNSAGKAALIANEHKSLPAWQPEVNSISSRAALLAHNDVLKRNSGVKEMKKEENHAADLAMQKKASESHTLNEEVDERRSKALIAATGAFTGRKRSDSTPASMSSKTELLHLSRNKPAAASLVHNTTQGQRQPFNGSNDSASQAERTRYLGRNFPKEMFTEHPPVSIEVEEKNHQDALRASALSMAKKMYQVQQSQIEAAAGIQRSSVSNAAAKAYEGEHPTSNNDIKQQAIQYLNIQEAAHKLAMERLAKIDVDDTKAFRDYYGYGKVPSKKRLSIHFGRKRASSESSVKGSDSIEVSPNIRPQKTLLSDQVAEMDTIKRQKDREVLLALAEKRVQAQMHDMDEKVHAQTGKITPAMMDEWERIAQARARSDEETRKMNHGKVHIGSGKYVELSEVNAIAASRIQPTLDEITEAATKQRAIDEERRLDQQEQKRQMQMRKQQESELKAEEKRIKSDEKRANHARKAEEKKILRTEKEAVKAQKTEEKRIQKEQRKLKGTENSMSQKAPLVEAEAEAKTGSEHEEEEIHEGNVSSPSSDVSDLHVNSDNREDSKTTSQTSNVEPTGFKSFLKKFKHKPKSSASENESHTSDGAAKVEINHPDTTTSQPQNVPITQNQSQTGRSPSISSISNDSLSERYEQAEDRLSRVSSLSNKEFDETRDTFNELLAPQPNFMTQGKINAGSPVPRDSKFQEEL